MEFSIIVGGGEIIENFIFFLILTASHRILLTRDKVLILIPIVGHIWREGLHVASQVQDLVPHLLLYGALWLEHHVQMCWK